MTYPNGVHATVPNEVYHADEALSVSGAKLLLPPSCPALFRWTRDNGQKPRRVFDFGTLAHTLVLGVGEESLVVVDADDYRTKAAQQARDAAHARGRTPVLGKEIEVARRMADAVLTHPVAGPLFTAGGLAEHSLWWTDDETGVRLRARPDWITADGRTLVDYKTSTTANPSVLQRKWFDLAYHMQDAWYRTGLTAATGVTDPDFVFVAQTKEPPYLVTVVRYDADAVAEGHRMMRRAVNVYAQCAQSGVWPAYTDSITALSLPVWALRDADTEAAQQMIKELEELYR